MTRKWWSHACTCNDQKVVVMHLYYNDQKVVVTRLYLQ